MSHGKLIARPTRDRVAGAAHRFQEDAVHRFPTTGKALVAALAPLLLAVLVGAGATGADGAQAQRGQTSARSAQAQALTVVPVLPPADTSWGGCGGSCNQQP
ncbi:hypothetical protein [Streptacidiphilus monticola]|uniref:Uncharacterized protein n=1 Tax=Streptacidiphilus monticola TaxID=2161674 RepID=A0ABW1G8X6_9ACTN